MKRFQIFRPGKHVSAAGVPLNFTEQDLQAAVKAYDPALHEAPITVGHPKDNLPAYGWIKGVDFADGHLWADPQQVEPQFAEMVATGRFKKRSASFYMPDSPSNPVPGTFYLRHVAFLGAQPPAVKGLKPVDYSEEELTVSFEEEADFDDGGYLASLMAGVTRRLREWFIAEKGIDAADQVVPSYVVSDFEAEARKPVAASPSVGFDEGNMAITEAQFAELQKQLTTANDQIKALTAAEAERTRVATEAAAAKAKADTEAAFAEREKAIKAGEQQLARQAIELQVEALAKDGKVLPARKAQVVSFALGLDDKAATVEFGEGDKAVKMTQRAAYLAELASRQPEVNFGEHAGASRTDNAGATMDAKRLATRARAYHDKQAAAGTHISFTEAVAAVARGEDEAK